MGKIGVNHCSQCGGTGKIFNNVPGSMLLRTKMVIVVQQPYPEDCNICNGTGHIVFVLEEET